MHDTCSRDKDQLSHESQHSRPRPYPGLVSAARPSAFSRGDYAQPESGTGVIVNLRQAVNLPTHIGIAGVILLCMGFCWPWASSITTLHRKTTVITLFKLEGTRLKRWMLLRQIPSDHPHRHPYWLTTFCCSCNPYCTKFTSGSGKALRYKALIYPYFPCHFHGRWDTELLGQLL